MTITDAIQRVFRTAKGLSQNSVAESAGVNKGQLSSWLGGGSSLGDDRQAKVVAAILEMYASLDVDKQTKDAYDADLADALLAISTYGPYQIAKYGQEDRAWMGEPISPQNRLYVTREIEENLNLDLEHPRLSVGIVGGVGMGKSSTLFHVQQRLQSKDDFVLRVDCADFAHATPSDGYRVLEWFAEVCEQQLPAASRQVVLRQADQFGDWVMKNVIASLQDPRSRERRCHFVIDHMEKLYVHDADPNEALTALRILGVALHRFQANSSGVPALQNVRFIFAFDQGSYAIIRSPWLLSSLLRTLSIHALIPLTQNQVLDLVKRYGLKVGDTDRTFNEVWSRWGGHPLFTQLGIHSCKMSGDSSSATIEAAWAVVEQSMATLWYAELYEFVQLNCAQHEYLDVPTFTSYQTLLSSGLFRPRFKTTSTSPDNEREDKQIRLCCEPNGSWFAEKLRRLPPYAGPRV